MTTPKKQSAEAAVRDIRRRTRLLTCQQPSRLSTETGDEPPGTQPLGGPEARSRASLTRRSRPPI